ncbi:sensor histidine kinase [Paraurantiacibacter namhicola]|uniref:histidine kinase n=1 Tax=Paraurantiacibacter namhicola TaxID=645517 RepID=A0A1C7D5D0_9SPHN|nr:CHASE3 domain-containing protein [Paraurantiacibacter namhicola]ANU06531.1 Blue-light-activated histidine kinase 1 [Paraurantiacibacter namhicola]
MAYRPPPHRWALPILLGLTAMALLAMVALVWNTIEAERDERTQVLATTKVLGEVQAVRRGLVEAESGQRGYLLSLDSDYLDSYREGRADVMPAIARLRDALGRDMTPEQGVLVTELAAGVSDIFGEMDRQVQDVSTGTLDVSRSLVFADGEEALMGTLREKLDALERNEEGLLIAAAQRTDAVEARVLPLLAALVLLVLLSVYFTFRLVRRTAEAEAEASHAAELEVARDRADLLAKELNHRVKNLFAVVLAIVQMSGKGKPEAKETVGAITERIRALLTAHDVTQGAGGHAVASVRDLVETTLAPYRSDIRTTQVTGHDVMLPAEKVTPLGLVLHELVTNAVKYGCWQQDGLLDVHWDNYDGTLRLHWDEYCEQAGEEPASRGFGSQLIEGSARQMGGEITRKFTPQGLRVLIAIPLEGG